MKITNLILALFTLGFTPLATAGINTPDSSLNVIDKGVVAAKMVDGKNKLFTYDYRAALNTFREIAQMDPKNAMANFYIAECYYELYHYDLAKEYLDKAVTLNPNVDNESDYLYGKIYHHLEKFDDAIASFEKFKGKIKPEKLKDYDVDYYIAQINNAKKYMAAPVSVTITNAGQNINSRNDDYSALVSPDGKLLYFTSRRAQSTGGHTATDGKFYEDIFVCKQKEDGTWGEAEQVEGKLNTDEHDNCCYLSADGTEMYITQNIDGATKSSDIAVSKMSKSGKWGMAKLQKTLNSTYFDASPTLTPDEKTIYFISERNGEKSGSDIFKSTKNGREWSEPIPVKSCNSAENESAVWLHPNGKWLFFSSKGFDSMGGYDIFVSEWNGSDWGTPRNLGYPINTVNNDLYFRISPDGKYAYISSFRNDGVGDMDIYVVDLSAIDWLK